MKSFLFLLIPIISLAACSSNQPGSVEPSITVIPVTATLPPTQIAMPTSEIRSVAPTPTTDPSISAQLFSGSNVNFELNRVDQQGEVIVNVTPLNLKTSGDTLEFKVILDTHSVELSMNPANHATLIADTGMVVEANAWDGPLGGHHVSGKLTFPASVDGVSILDGATKLTMQLRDVGAELRTFEWILP
jgi:uncharacterized protein YcfL